MRNTIELTEPEDALRQLLLDVADYVAAQPGCKKPELRFTGGWVRDKLLGYASKDIDIGIDSMTGFEFGVLMSQFLTAPERRTKYGSNVLGSLATIKANPEKSKHLETVTTRILGLDIDLVNLRKETYLEDSRTPTMEFGTPEEDALRRDATVNALFYNLISKDVEDFTGRGLHDMETGVIRTPLPPYQTFMDDPLRVLRCVRFASKLGYSIDPEAEKSMGESSIKDALRAKISRERIGVEIEKMLRGPNPHIALSLIDRLGLYATIFTNPASSASVKVSTRSWQKAYDQLHSMVHDDKISRPSREVLSILAITGKDAQKDLLFRAWLLCALAPWARVEVSQQHSFNSKLLPPAAATIAREGLKIDNKSMDVIKNCVLYLDEIIASVNAHASEDTNSGVPSKRKQVYLSREALGMSIRRWGSQWRSIVIFGLLVQVMEAADDQEILTLVRSYHAWLLRLQELDLLEANSIKPLVDGKQIMAATNRKGGQWLASALDTAMEWQLRNPGEANAECILAEITPKYRQ